MVSKMNIWPSPEYIDQYMPNNFRPNYFRPNYALTSIILDCTEIKVQQASIN